MDKYYIFLQFLSIFLTYGVARNFLDKGKAKNVQEVLGLLIYFCVVGLAVSYPYFNDHKLQYFLLVACYPFMALLAIYKKEKPNTFKAKI